MAATTPRVLHVTTGLELNGAERMLVNCCEASRSAGFDPHVASLKPGGGAVALLEALGVPVFQLNASPKRPNLGALHRLRAHISDLQPDLVKGWMYHGNLFAAAGVAGRSGLGGKRLSWGIYNSALDLSKYHWSMSAVVKAGARLSSYPRAISYNSLQAQRDHEAMGFAASGSLQIGNGVDLNRFRPSEEARHAARARFGIPPEATVALIVARVDPQKDWDTILAALPGVADLVTVAVGPTTVNLPDLPGLMKIGAQDDMAAIYPMGDVFLLPSAFGEGTSVAMCEAMACGLPAILTDVGDHARFVDGAGVLVPRQDPAALAEALASLRDDPDQRAQLGLGARQMAQSNFGMAQSFVPLFAAWREMLAA